MAKIVFVRETGGGGGGAPIRRKFEERQQNNGLIREALRVVFCCSLSQTKDAYFRILYLCGLSVTADAPSSHRMEFIAEINKD